MQDFQHYYHLRRAGYDPKEVGSGMLRSVRTTLKHYITAVGESALKSSLLELYYSLAKPHDMNALATEIENHIRQIEQINDENRMQNGIRLSIIRMLTELKSHVRDLALAS